MRPDRHRYHPVGNRMPTDALDGGDVQLRRQVDVETVVVVREEAMFGDEVLQPAPS